jgi:hypothetical protein
MMNGSSKPNRHHTSNMSFWLPLALCQIADAPLRRQPLFDSSPFRLLNSAALPSGCAIARPTRRRVNSKCGVTLKIAESISAVPGSLFPTFVISGQKPGLSPSYLPRYCSKVITDRFHRAQGAELVIERDTQGGGSAKRIGVRRRLTGLPFRSCLRVATRARNKTEINDWSSAGSAEPPRSERRCQYRETGGKELPRGSPQASSRPSSRPLSVERSFRAHASSFAELARLF